MDPVKASLLWASENPALGTRLPRMRFVQRSVSRFMPGESAEDALAAAERIGRELGVATTFTRLGENTRDLSLAAEAAGEYLRLLDRIEETELYPSKRIAYQFSAAGHELAQLLLGSELSHPKDAISAYYRSRPILLAAGLTVDEAFGGPLGKAGGYSDGRDIGVVCNLPGRGRATGRGGCRSLTFLHVSVRLLPDSYVGTGPYRRDVSVSRSDVSERKPI